MTRERLIAERFATLTAEKKKDFLNVLRQERIDFPMLPIFRSTAGQAQCPLSYAQAGQWFLWQLDPHSPAYHITSALKLKGPLDMAAVRTAFSGLVQRHASL